ncbi:hypothetical protein DXU77_20435 [Pseudomonas lactis]|nr:hypothetical protein [Pseudomonas lactis]
MLAKNSPAPRSFREPALSLTLFASKLAPTVPTHFSVRASSPNVMAACRRCCEIGGSCGSGR